MKAARLYGVNDIRVEELPEDKMQDHSVRIQVQAAGICGSDLHNFATGQWMDAVPITPGHEFCGVITEIGSAVSTFSVGNKVVVDSRVTCKSCPACLDGLYNHCESLGFVGEVCNGGFAEYCVIEESALIKVPDHLPATIAALSEPLGVALRVVNQLSPPVGEKVKIFGGGAIGGLTALLLQEIYQCEIDLSEPNLHRKSILEGILSLSSFTSYSYAVDATGIASVINNVIQAIRPNSRLALVGLPMANQEVDLLSVVEKEIHIIGCSVFQSEQKEVINLLDKLQDKLVKLISSPIALEHINETYQTLKTSNVPYIKAIINPQIGVIL